MPRRAVAIAIAAVVTFGLIAAVAVFLLAREPEKLAGVAAPSASPSVDQASKKAAERAAIDPGGAEACRLVRTAAASEKLMDTATVTAIETAAKRSYDQGIHFSGLMLKDRQNLAIAAVGAPDELKYRLGLMTTATEMETKCVKAGYFD